MATFYRYKLFKIKKWFGIDNDCRIITGFIETTITTEHVILDTVNNKFIMAGSVPSAKYFLYNGTGFFRGVIWGIPITIDNIRYTFDEQGRVIKEERVDTTNMTLLDNINCSWEYDPVINKWRYYDIDVFGNRHYYKNGIYPIMYLGKTSNYLFDSNGYVNIVLNY